jgi:hypothetical protein
MVMVVIEGVLREELQRLQDMEKACEEKLASLPKGSFQQRLISGRSYVYLKFRDEAGKVVQKYLGAMESEQVKEIRRQIEMRRKHAAALREIQAEIKLIGKVIK